ncbi:MAG TPA: class I SAM-dependent methyltransferase [Rhizomicrobium sp.]|nr:class I SAM-dependent methyltransferase [Rhizomicrobium sp.]
MYELLKNLVERPAPFSVDTAAALWTDKYISARMLECHLDPESDLASRRPEGVDRIVKWIETRLGLAGKALTDLGCGPGLYAERMAMHGARVTGVDFSVRSLAYAKQSATAQRLTIAYRLADYMKDALTGGQDIVTLIYGDYCVLSPPQRRALLERVRAMLKPGGHFLFDVFSLAQFGQRSEEFRCERRLMSGFWADGDYFGFRATHLYPELYLALDRYLIVEPERTKDIFNWMQYFSPDDVAAELREAGFEVAEIFDVETGKRWLERSAPFGVLAKRN